MITMKRITRGKNALQWNYRGRSGYSE